MGRSSEWPSRRSGVVQLAFSNQSGELQSEFSWHRLTHPFWSGVQTARVFFSVWSKWGEVVRLDAALPSVESSDVCYFSCFVFMKLLTVTCCSAPDQWNTAFAFMAFFCFLNRFCIVWNKKFPTLFCCTGYVCVCVCFQFRACHRKPRSMKLVTWRRIKAPVVVLHFIPMVCHSFSLSPFPQCIIIMCLRCHVFFATYYRIK